MIPKAKFNIDATDRQGSHEQQSTTPTLVGTQPRKRAAGGTGVLLRDVLINVSLEPLVQHVGTSARVREISPTTMIQDTPHKFGPNNHVQGFRYSRNTSRRTVILPRVSIILKIQAPHIDGYNHTNTLYTVSIIYHTKYYLSYSHVSGCSEVAA